MIDSSISHYEFVLVNNMLKKYDDIKKKLKILIINKYVWCNYTNGVDTSQFAEKDDLANLKSEVCKLNIDK